MIRITLTDQQLFDVILAVYAAKAAEPAGAKVTAAQSEAQLRREKLLEKLHGAFDRNRDTDRSGIQRPVAANTGARSARAGV